MQQPWLNHYPVGIPKVIDSDSTQTVVDIFFQSCQNFAHQPAYSNLGQTYTYRQLLKKSQDFASFLQHHLKLKKGDRIALMLPNLLQYPVALFGSLMAGLVVVNVNPLYTQRELEHQLNDAQVATIVIVENFAKTLAKIQDQVPVKNIITTRVGDCLSPLKRVAVNFTVKYIKRMVPNFDLADTLTFTQAMRLGARQNFTPTDISHQDLAFLQYTGGTTGPAKGVRLLHRNIVANINQCSAWLSKTLETGQERAITALPLYHVFALTANCLVFLKYGGHNALVTNPRDIDHLIKVFARHKPTAFTGVNTLFNALISRRAFQALDFSALKLSLGGGAAVQKTVAQKWQAATGGPIIQAYGLTETSPAAIINPLDLKDYSPSIGLPIPSTHVVIRNDEGDDQPIGQAGELCIRGPQVTPGYWHNITADKESFFEDGFLRTGDIATMDENGFFTIVDRKKDMILVSGFNVFPNEIEQVAAGCPGVIEVACIGVADEHSGEVVKLFVVRENDSITQETIIDYCRQRLTGYKVPKQIEFIESMPKSNVGKILRRELKKADS